MAESVNPAAIVILGASALAALTTRGFGVAECTQLAGWLCDVLDALEAGGSTLTTVRDRVRELVVDLCHRHPVYR